MSATAVEGGSGSQKGGSISCNPPGQLPYGYFHSPGLATKLRAKCDTDMDREMEKGERESGRRTRKLEWRLGGLSGWQKDEKRRTQPV